MNERCTDFELLQAFIRHTDQQPFAEIVRRHLDLVYATALRKVADPGAAEEISQNVFAALSRKAWRFTSDDSLPAWLHRAALLESKEWLRHELRRRRREQTASELGTTMKTPDEQPAIRALVPLIDEALLSLAEKDRSALLLRFYESQSFREVGSALGLNEDAARKRVGGALEKLVSFFKRRGFRTASSAAMTAVLQQTAASTSAATATAVVNATLLAAPPGFTGLAAFLGRVAGLTKIQTAALCLIVAVGPIAWKWNVMSSMHKDFAALESKSTQTREHIDALSTEIARLRSRVARHESAKSHAAQLRAQNEAATRKLEAIKGQIRGMLSDQNYRWPEDLPFVRVPKTALSAMEMSMPVRSPGAVTPTAREMLGLTPDERERIEVALADYFFSLENRIQSSLYETNNPSRRRLPDDVVASKVFVVPALGKGVREASDRMFTEVRTALGEERWELLKPAFEFRGTRSLREIMNLGHFEQPQELAAWIRQKENGLGVDYSWSDKSSYWVRSAGDLSQYSPEATHDSTAGEELRSSKLPTALLDCVVSWLTDEAFKRISVSGNQ